jgi:muconolactone delta-isomerase
MQYLVQLRLRNSANPMSPSDGIGFIEDLILPTLERCKKLQEDQKILAGGPMSGAVALALIVTARSAQELDDLVTSLPVWPRMETEVIPLTTFDERRQSVLSKLDGLKTQASESGMSRSGGSR